MWLYRLAATCGLFFATANLTHAATLSVQETLGTFNLVTESFTGSNDIEGRSYVGATVTDTNIGKSGTKAPADGTGFAAFNIDGDLVNSSIDVEGEVRLSGANVGSVSPNGTIVENVTDLPMIDFGAYAAEAAYFASLPGIAADLSDMNNKTFGGATIIDVTLSDLASGGYSFDRSGIDYLIVNVSGLSGTFQMNPLGGAKDDAPYVLWNFFEATSIVVNSVIEGHVLAPFAHMSGFSGSTEGTVIAKSVDLSNGELHQQDWRGDLSVPAVPLPAGLPLAVTGLAVFAMARAKARRGVRKPA